MAHSHAAFQDRCLAAFLCLLLMAPTGWGLFTYLSIDHSNDIRTGCCGCCFTLSHGDCRPSILSLRSSVSSGRSDDRMAFSSIQLLSRALRHRTRCVLVIIVGMLRVHFTHHRSFPMHERPNQPMKRTSSRIASTVHMISSPVDLGGSLAPTGRSSINSGDFSAKRKACEGSCRLE